MELPANITEALAVLRAHGAHGCVVGGCVRDALLGKQPQDYDIAVNVPPEETEAAFAGYRVIETGLKHGTVTVVIGGENVEITSFRTDGAYTDLRRPESVRFTPELREDLSRRDFTVNAMAYSPEDGLTDLFGGRQDLADRVLRCVGDPDRRFGEDALRILRALRFAAVLEFTIEPETAAALRRSAENLTRISAERIFAELKKLLTGAACAKVLKEYRQVLEICLPALQGVPPAAYAEAADAAGALRDGTLSFAALFAPPGEEAAERTCRALKTDNRFRTEVCFAVAHKDDAFSAPGQARRFLGAHGRERCLRLLRFRAALGIGGGALADVCKAPDGLPASLADLNVNGGDLAALGAEGKRIGALLEALLERAAEGALPNERAALLNEARALLEKKEDDPD